MFVDLFLFFNFDSAAHDPFRGQNMTLISADQHLFVYLSAGKFMFLSCYILLYFPTFPKWYEWNLIPSQFLWQVVSLYDTTYFIIRLLWIHLA